MDDKELQGQESSPSPTQNTDAGAKSTEAESSPAPGAKEPEDLLSVVRDVVGEKTPGSETASPADAGGESGQKTDPASKEGESEPDDEHFTDAPFHKHPRFQQLLKERNTFKQDAVRYRNVQTFLDSHGIAPEEASEAMTIVALMKSNPVEAWARMRPTVEKLLHLAGEILPPELEQRVAHGELSKDAARELSTAKARAEAVDQQRKFEQQQAEQQAQQRLRQECMESASKWEQDRRIKDPDFEAKYVALQKEVRWLQAEEGVPNTPEGVKAQLEKAYKAVNEQIRPANPAARPAIKPLTATGGGNANTRPEPKSILDIVKAGGV